MDIIPRLAGCLLANWTLLRTQFYEVDRIAFKHSDGTNKMQESVSILEQKDIAGPSTAKESKSLMLAY